MNMSSQIRYIIKILYTVAYLNIEISKKGEKLYSIMNCSMKLGYERFIKHSSILTLQLTNSIETSLSKGRYQ